MSETENETRFVTILDVVEARGAEKGPGGSISGREFERLGFAFIGGCLTCSATIAAYGACPTKSGYWRCQDCAAVEGDGFASVEDYTAWERANGEPQQQHEGPDDPPTEIRESIDRYVRDRIRPGDFLQAVLANDLLDAVCRADAENRAKLLQIVLYVHNDVQPGWCHGSREAIERWLEGATEPPRKE